jgi:hypothetical protein
MAEASRAEFRHSDLNDRFIMWANLGFGVVKNWGVAMFALMVGVIPLGILLYMFRGPLELLTGSSPGDWGTEWMVGLYLGSSVPIGLYCTWVRWKRLQLNRLVVDANGIEYLWYPRKLRRVPWSQVTRVRDPYIPEDEGPTELIFETAGGKFTLDGEFWPLGAIEAAVARHFKITRDRDKVKN